MVIQISGLAPLPRKSVLFPFSIMPHIFKSILLLGVQSDDCGLES